MSHIHDVIDKDTHFSIDPVTRLITNKSADKKTIIQYDHNAERFTFELPKYIEGHDMSACNRVSVTYINIDSTTLEEHVDVYPVEDLAVSATDDTIVTCSWTISHNATQFAGPLIFSVSYACVTGDVVDYNWSTAIYKEIEVTDGLNGNDEVVTQYSDVLQMWWKKLFMLEGGTIDESTGNALTFWIGSYEEYEALPDEDKNIENCLYVFEDDPTLSDMYTRLASVESSVAQVNNELERVTQSNLEAVDKVVTAEVAVKNMSSIVNDLQSRVSELEEDDSESTGGGVTLWTGTSAPTFPLTVTGLSKYTVLLIRTSLGALVLCSLDSGKINGSYAYLSYIADSRYGLQLECINMKCDGDTITYNDCTILRSDGSAEAIDISKIIGII